MFNFGEWEKHFDLSAKFLLYEISNTAVSSSGGKKSYILVILLFFKEMNITLFIVSASIPKLHQYRNSQGFW